MATLRSSTLEYHSANAYRVVPWPSGAQVGDLVVIAIGNRYLPSLPEGWTTVDVLSGTNQSGRLAWKILTGADIGGGTYTYVLAGTGTGSVATLCFVGGTFNPDSPIANYVSSIAADINEFMPYVPLNTGQTLYHFGTARTTAIGIALSSDGVLLQRGDAAVDVEASLYGDTANSETTRHTTWTATAASTGSYKVSFAVTSPAGSITLPGLTGGVAYMLVSTYSATAYAPDDGSIQDLNSPQLVVMADGNPSPFQVQFQTSPSSLFTSISWSTTLTGRTKGTVSATVGVALDDQTRHYWRARSGDGTTWGPWSATRSFVVQLGITAAAEYIYENIGVTLTLDDRVGEYVTENVGLPLLPVDIGIEYVTENVGFRNVLADIANEYLYLNVDQSIPAPHLWFVYKVYGFAEDHVFLYGQGLGTLQDQFNATIRMDYGPNYAYTDLYPGIFDWSVNPAGPHAYDSLRRVYAGADGAPPTATVECDIVEIIIPTAAVADTAQTDYLYAVTDGGTSNRLPFLLYPVIPLPMTTSPSQNSSGGAVRIGGDPVGPPTEIVEHYAAYALEPYMLSSGRLERLPEHSAISRSDFTLAVGTPTEDLEDPVTATVPLSLRWRPLGGDVVPRPDLGTGASLWVPTTASTQGWKMFSDTAPYVDAAHTIPSRSGEIPRPAMVFPGDAYVELLNPLPTGPVIDLAMVIQLYARSAQKQVLLSSKGALPAGKTHFELSLTSDLLSFTAGSRMAQFRLPSTHFGQRPFILGMAINGRTGYVMTITTEPQTSKFVISELPSTGLGLWIGRATDGDPDTMAEMDVLDIAMNTVGISSYEMWKVMNAFDSIYGVTDQ